MGTAAAIGIAILTSLVAAEFYAWVPHVCRRLVRFHAARTPQSLREQLTEQWTADLDALPGNIAKLLFAADLYRARLQITRSTETVKWKFPLPRVFRTLHLISLSEAKILVSGGSSYAQQVLVSVVACLSHKALRSLDCASLSDVTLTGALYGMVDAGCIVVLHDVQLLSSRSQASLLRVLEDGEVEDLATGRRKELSSRIVATSNLKDLQGRVKSGTFREDLYYRLNVIPIEIPMFISTSARLASMSGLSPSAVGGYLAETLWKGSAH